MNIIYPVRSIRRGNKDGWYIRIDLSNAFGKINRNKLWRILYEKGQPTELIKMIESCRNNHKLRGGHNGGLGQLTTSNVGGFQGSLLVL